uniref:Uridine diphosphate glucose pyrophosphatase NUDT22 n=1 Tax=Pogona vitticeps TaxID=103695 RepID=A0A6J0UH00_9SAUR
MDPEISILFQCPSPNGITESQVRAEVSPRYDRRLLLGDQLQIETAWEARRQESPWLFDGSKFRLNSLRIDEGIVTFCLGLTCYKDFVGTNLSKTAEQLQERGRQDFGDSRAYLAHPLGVGAMLHMADDQFVFLRRSLCVAEAPGKMDIPGGHPEPQVVKDQTASEGPICHQDLRGELVVQELFSAVLREIQDEVNLPASSLSRPVLLGIARNETSAGRCSVEFYVRCSLTSEQAKHCYAIGGPEAHESTSIIFIKREDVLTLEQNGELWKELCPSAKGAVRLYTVANGYTKHQLPPSHQLFFGKSGEVPPEVQREGSLPTHHPQTTNQ